MPSPREVERPVSCRPRTRLPRCERPARPDTLSAEIHRAHFAANPDARASPRWAGKQPGIVLRLSRTNAHRGPSVPEPLPLPIVLMQGHERTALSAAAPLPPPRERVAGQTAEYPRSRLLSQPPARATQVPTPWATLADPSTRPEQFQGDAAYNPIASFSLTTF